MHTNTFFVKLVLVTWRQSEKAHLLKLGESKRVAVLGSELHESHVGRMCELSDDAETGKQSEKGLGGLRQKVVNGGRRVAVIHAFNFCC